MKPVPHAYWLIYILQRDQMRFSAFENPIQFRDKFLEIEDNIRYLPASLKRSLAECLQSPEFLQQTTNELITLPDKY
jgi:hypothetical protein